MKRTVTVIYTCKLKKVKNATARFDHRHEPLFKKTKVYSPRRKTVKGSLRILPKIL